MRRSDSPVTTNFKPVIKQPGDVIRSEDWNAIQNGLLNEIVRLNEKLRALKEYVDNMSERITITNLESPIGKGYNLLDVIPTETKSYGVRIMGLITKQWVTAVRGIGDICSFGITEYCDMIYYWSGAENGNRPTLDITLEYIDGTNTKAATNLFINEKSKLSPVHKDNPYLQFLFSENGIWYKYAIRNPSPEKEVRYIKFRNTSQESNTRIGNILQLKSKLRQFRM